MNTIKKAWGLVVLVACSLTACKKFVEIPPPSTKLVSESVFNNSNAATSALLNIYQEMYNNNESLNMARETGFLGDELSIYTSNPTFRQYFSNSMAASNTFGPWNNAYHYIYEANSIIEGLQNNKAIPSPIAKQLNGECKFIRAFWYSYLVNCYGEVPLVVHTDYTVNLKLPRSSKAVIYDQIISDLKDAQNLLSTDFVDATDTSSTSERVRPTKWAATSLLSRVYLYQGNYSDAYIQASAVIQNTNMFKLESDLNQVFKMNSNEAIWQISIPIPNAINTDDGSVFILKSTPKQQAISPQLINAFESTDQRKTQWIGTYVTKSAPIDTFYYPFKYKVSNSSDISEYQMVIRLAELYLIRAEAQSKGAGNGITGSIADLNMIRNRAGLTNYSGPILPDSVFAAIQHERQVELFTEWGHRWFDLIRSSNIDAVMGQPGNVCAFKGGTWQPFKALFPIPQTERNTDINLSQNPGY